MTKDETLPEEEFNASLPNIDDDGKITPFIQIVDPKQALKDVRDEKVPEIVVGISMDF